MKKFDGETLKNPLLFEESRPSLAILFMITAMFLISLVDSFCKVFTDELHAVQLVWVILLEFLQRSVCTLFFADWDSEHSPIRTGWACIGSDQAAW